MRLVQNKHFFLYGIDPARRWRAIRFRFVRYIASLILQYYNIVHISMNRNLEKKNSTRHAIICLRLTRGQDQTIPASDTPGALPALAPPAGNYTSVGAEQKSGKRCRHQHHKRKKRVSTKKVRMTVSGFHIQRQTRKKGFSTHAPKRVRGVSTLTP